MDQSDLGMDMHVAVFAIAGSLTTAEAKQLQQDAIEIIGMTPVLAPAVWERCAEAEKQGSENTTVVQPFVTAQPLAESVAAVARGYTMPGQMMITDSWTTCEGFYLILCSCRPFCAERLYRWLRHTGWKVISYDRATATLAKRKKPLWQRIWGD